MRGGIDPSCELDYPAVTSASRTCEHHNGHPLGQLELLGFFGAGHARMQALGDGFRFQPLQSENGEAAAPSGRPYCGINERRTFDVFGTVVAGERVRWCVTVLD